MKDSNGNIVRAGDEIKTERGVTLQIVEENNILYMVNSGNNQKRALSDLNVEFFIIGKK